MSSQIIGKVKGGKSGKTFEVKWSPSDRNVYVRIAGWTRAGKAGSANDAMNVAEAFGYNK